MSLKIPTQNNITIYEGNSTNSSSRTKREKVEDAAAATGAAGAGAAATRGGNALKFFKSAEKTNYITGAAAQATRAVEQPVKQSKSLINAFKINYRNITNQIKTWAENSRMPNFMKAMFTGKLAEGLGKGAAVFVFITGIGEVFHTLMKNINNASMKMATMANPYDTYDNFEYVDQREAFARYYANQAKYQHY